MSQVLISKRTILYCRTAVKDKNRKESRGISQQIMSLKKYAAKHSMQIVGIFIDDGISGASLNRPGLDKLRRVIQKGGVDIVLASRLDRLSRNVLHTALLMQEFKQKGTELVIPSMPYQGAEVKLFFGFVSGMAGFNRYAYE